MILHCHIWSAMKMSHTNLILFNSFIYRHWNITKLNVPCFSAIGEQLWGYDNVVWQLIKLWLCHSWSAHSRECQLQRTQKNIIFYKKAIFLFTFSFLTIRFHLSQNWTNGCGSLHGYFTKWNQIRFVPRPRYAF